MLVLWSFACQTNAPGRPAPEAPPPSDTVVSEGPDGALARLSHVQWKLTTRDLLFLDEDLDLTDQFVGDVATSWFENDRDGLTVHPTLWLQYQGATETLAGLAAVDPRILSKIAPERDRDTWIRTFGKRAFRRPLTEPEVYAFSRLFDEGAAIFHTGDPFADGVHAAVAGFLQSPRFLYRTLGLAGPGDDALGTSPPLLDDWELASKLSYALWNTMPDDRLFAAAEAGFTDETYAAEAERMLADPRAHAMIRDLHRQWLHVDSYQNIDRSVDENHADYRLSTPYAMETEVYAFVDAVAFDGGTVADLFTRRDTIAESRLAALYGLSGVEGSDLVPVTLDPDQRAGLFTLSGFLALTADGDEPGLIHRGAWINEAVLCVHIPPPPPNVPPLPFDDVDLTLRERIENHTSTCGLGCHTDFINPIGFAFANYSATGSYVTLDHGHPIDATGTYRFEDRTASYDGAVELSELLAREPQAHRCYVSHLLAYTEGRGVDPDDAERIEALTARSLRGEPIFDLLRDLVTDDAFRRRPVPGPG